MAQQVKDPALSLLWLRSLLWREFDPWPLNFHVPQVRLKKKFFLKREGVLTVAQWVKNPT